MLFNTMEFVIFFFLVITAITIIKHKKFQHLFLLFASYFFFYFSSNILISLLIFSTILDFYIGKEIFQATTLRRKKILLVISLTGNLGLLGFFKYADFGINQLNVLVSNFGFEEIPLLELVVPIGISFYTFQTISYTIDIFRGNLNPSKSLAEFALYVAFFPQLVAGPILRASQFLPQLREKLERGNTSLKQHLIQIKSTHLKFGITLIAIGFSKKMFFADNIAPLVNQIFENPIGSDSFTIILGTIAFGIQLYGDFSGYSDIAIGAAFILGFIVPRNFNNPYFAISPTDFWKRFHISLSTWVRDYLYFPLIFKHRNSIWVITGSLLGSMLLLGLWHGSSWNFVIFGGLHGVYLAVHTILRRKNYKTSISSFFKSNAGKWIGFIITQYFIFFAFIAFRVQDFEYMFYSMQKYLIWDLQIDEFISIVSVNKLPIVLMISFIILNFISYRKENLIHKISSMKLKYWGVFLLVILSTILIFYDLNPHDFIYFRF